MPFASLKAFIPSTDSQAFISSAGLKTYFSR